MHFYNKTQTQFYATANIVFKPSVYAKDNKFHIKQISRSVTLNVKNVKENNVHQINMQRFN